MSQPRRLLALVGALLALVVSACGSAPTEQQRKPGDRAIHHAAGTTMVSSDPKRVVVLDTGELDSMLALGVNPVGTTVASANQKQPPYLADKLRGVENVGTISAPNLEKIAMLKPDLILSSKVRDGDKYDQLSKIAPTVLAESPGKSWKENFLLDADAVGKKAEAEKILAAYHQKAVSVGRQMGDPSRTKVSVARFASGGNDIRLYGKGSFIGTVLADAGFSRPENQRTETTFTKISREQLAQADGDLLFYGAYGPTGKAKLDETVASGQWKHLNAVRNGKAHEVPDHTWFLGVGPIGASLVLDDLRKLATK